MFIKPLPIFINSESYHNPIHCEPQHIPYLINLLNNKMPIYVTPKADGIRRHLMVKNSKNDQTIYLVESLENGDHIDYLIIDVIRCGSKLPQNLDKRIKMLESLLGQKIIHQIDISSLTQDEMIKILDQNYPVYQSSSVNLMIKPIIELLWNESYSMKREHMICLFNKLMKNSKTNYPTDGWIVYPNTNPSTIPIKFKPLDFLTIDLLHQNGVEYLLNMSKLEQITDHQINFSSNSGINGEIQRYLPTYCSDTNQFNLTICGKRDDKTEPNSLNIIQSIMSRIKSKWTSEQVIDQYLSSDITYYQHIEERPTISNGIIKLLERQREKIINLFKKFDFHNKTILDLGAGNCSIVNFLKSYNFKRYYGFDIDPIIQANSIGKYPKSTMIWGDMSKGIMEYYTNYLADPNIDMIISINSIHYFDLDSIAKLCCVSTKSVEKIIIFGMFAEPINQSIDHLYYSEDFNIISHPDDSQKFIFTYPWKHETFTESIKSIKSVVDNLNKYGYKLLDLSYDEQYDEQYNEQYEYYFKIHKMLVFERSF